MIDRPLAYAGIGSRRTPREMLGVMAVAARAFARFGLTLRTGGADGADTVFERAAVNAGAPVELYLPWPAFGGAAAAPTLTRPSAAAFEMAAAFHPAWDRLSRGARALHARNCHQVLGAGLDDPAIAVVCWTPDGSLDGRGRDTGGTGQALRIAAAHGVPVVNLARPAHVRALAVLMAHDPPASRDTAAALLRDQSTGLAQPAR